jgi:hypothetical protein
MFGRLHAFVGRIATWPAVALLFIGFVLCTLGFTARSERLGNNPPLLDVRYWYAPADVKALFDKLGQDGLSFYALTEVTLDLAFPFIYGGLLLILIYRLLEPKPARILLLVPLVGMISDLLENFSIALMAWTYTGGAPGFASFATVFTLTKNSLVRLALVIVLVGAIRAMILKRTGAGEQSGSVALR